MNRREFIRGIGRAICAGAAVPFIPSLIDTRSDWEKLRDIPPIIAAGSQSGKTLTAMEEMLRVVYGEGIVTISTPPGVDWFPKPKPRPYDEPFSLG